MLDEIVLAVLRTSKKPEGVARTNAMAIHALAVDLAP
jgi:hypothetical protein